jgi:ADP-ribosyl-[dinitrogen reductase] hydrolase
MIDRSSLDKGEFTVKEMMCESCCYNKIGSLRCVKYPNRKPNDVIKCVAECPEYLLNSNVAISGIVGAAVGDALGVPVEFVSRKELMKNPVEDMREYGTHNQPAGTWSDDTSLILALIAGLREKEYNIGSIADKFVQWYEKGKYTPYGKVFDIGNSTLDAILKIKNGVSFKESGGNQEKDNGNGSLMRILPLAFYLHDEENIEKRAKTIYEISGITHNHIRSKVACHIYIEIAIKLIEGKSLSNAYRDVCIMLKNYYVNKLNFIESRIFEDVLSGNIQSKRIEDIKSTGYVIDTIVSSLWCLLNTDSYKSAVLQAVNLGDDTDTVGAVTGGLAGIFYGLENIPKEWTQCLANNIIIFNAGQQLYKKCFNRT